MRHSEEKKGQVLHLSNDIRATCQNGCRVSEPLLTSGKQELYEAIINQYI